MGERVSYPQYIRLIELQKEAILIDQIIQEMMKKYDHSILASNEYFMALVDLHDSLKIMLPSHANDLPM